MIYEIAIEMIERELKWSKEYAKTFREVEGSMNRAFGAVCLYCEWYYREFSQDCDALTKEWNEHYRNEFMKLPKE